jgi:LmbE family N-acetylglucosaminyl deacetylase
MRPTRNWTSGLLVLLFLLMACQISGTATPAEVKAQQAKVLKGAGEALGLSGVFYLGYRDSGMAGSEDNKHPQALAAAPVEQVAGRIGEAFRRLKPEVIITSDPIGGYGHPDHIAIHKATVMAFKAAGDSQQYPESGPAFSVEIHCFPAGRCAVTQCAFAAMSSTQP